MTNSSNGIEATKRPSEPRIATLFSLPVSDCHTVRSVAQEAHRTLWAEEPDRAERWRRVGNMDQVYGVGRPLQTSPRRSSGRPPGDARHEHA